MLAEDLQTNASENCQADVISNGALSIFTEEGAQNSSKEGCLKFENKPEIWFHGRLTRHKAEEKLSSVRQIGAFLIRESGSLPKTFALSFMKSLEEIVHFRVTLICGEYFADDKKFESLAQLVEYYASRTEICPGRFLTCPVKPAQVIEPAPRKVVAVVPFRGMKDTDELSFVKGEIFTLIEEMGGNWLWVQSERSREKGLVYEGLVEDLTSESLVPIDLPYFYSKVEPQEASIMLSKAGKGSFFMKHSDTNPENITLVVHTNEKVQKVSIKSLKNGQFEMAGRLFKSLHDIVERYSHNEICDGVLLLKPLYKCLQQVPDSNSTLDVELYKKLRLNRFSYSTTGGKVSKSGCLFKKSKHDDRWRQLFFVLKEIEGQLFIYENDKHTKPKSVLDLCHCSYYDVHFSLFNQSNCFQLVLHAINKPVSLFFYSESESEFEEWSGLLKPLCSGQRQRLSSPFSCYRRISGGKGCVQKAFHLSVRIFEAKFDHAKHTVDICAVLSINEARIYRTSLYNALICSNSTGNLLLQEDINLENINCEVYTVSAHFFGKSKRTLRQTDLGCACIDLCSEISRVDHEDAVSLHRWVKLKCKEVDCGQCRVNLLYRRQVIMPVEEYGSLFEVLKANNFDVCRLISRYLNDDEQHRFSLALLNIFNANCVYLHFVIRQLQLEIQDSGESACLFRKTSFASILLYEFLNRDAIDYVRCALKAPVSKILDCKILLEVDSRKVRNSTNLDATHFCPANKNICQATNTNFLIDFAKDICSAINDSSPHFPKTVQYVMNNLKNDVAKRWPEDSQISLRAVSAFIFLRLICLALLDPKRYGLVTEPPPDYALRNLLLMARVVQKAANVREKKCCTPPDDDDYDLLESISTSYVHAKLCLSQFIDSVSRPISPPTNPSMKHCDITPDFAVILSLSQKYIDRIRTEPNQRISAFLPVIEMLQNHLNKYLDDEIKTPAQNR